MTDFLRTSQLDPAAGVLSDMSLAPLSGTQIVISSLCVCNRNSYPIKFRIAFAVGGAADATKHYLYYDKSVEANETFIATIGAVMFLGDIVRVYSDRGGTSFTAFGTEIV